ncbi:MULTISPECIES: hypothetical protein [unclassified Leucobacter]|uniref:hypothetical protein n=1 Tax=unclassified Leucobacter TaxID=2621730 RepID=UPI00301A34BC
MRERGERPKESLAPSAGPAKPGYEPPINWWRLDAEERTEILEVLVSWVPELCRRYGLTDAIIPPCWYRHEPLIQELLAFYQYRNQMQFLESAPPNAPLDVHYQLQLLLGRLRSWVSQSGCNAAEHMDTPVQPWVAEDDARAATWEVEAFQYLEKALEMWTKEEAE